jgi:DNA-binding MarR family transcriptional regulator
MSAMFSENAQKILVHLQVNPEANETAQEISDAIGVSVKSVNGVVTAALKRRGLADRKVVDGKDKKVIYLTETGKAVDPYMEKPEISMETE